MKLNIQNWRINKTESSKSKNGCNGELNPEVSLLHAKHILVAGIPLLLPASL